MLYFLKETVYTIVAAELRMKSRDQMPSLLHQHRISVITR